MSFRLLILTFFLSFSAFGSDLESDKARCSRAASQEYTWILSMSDWRMAYNTCLRNRLKALAPEYIRTSLNEMKREADCPEYLQNHTPVEFSMLGFEIVNHLTPKEMQSRRGSDNIEHHLELYYSRLRELRARK